MPTSLDGSILAFSAIAAALVVTPGAGTALLTTAVVTHGRRAGLETALGLLAGASIHALAAVAGTAMLLREFPSALAWIAILGGAYISGLGFLAVVGALRQPGPIVAPPEATAPAGHRFKLGGLITAFGNAPLPLFYLVVVPQYVPREMSRTTGAALLSVIHLAIAAVWMTALVQLVGTLAQLLRRPRVLKTLQVAMGLTLIVLGVKSVAGAF